MFKNLVIYRVGADWPARLEDVEAGLDGASFVPCAATQPLSAGWVPPRGVAHAPLIEVVDGQWHLRLLIEQRVLPGSVVRRRADERAVQIERDTGRKPGRKQMKELKEDAVLELLPQAFTKQVAIPVWLAPAQRLLMLDATSPARADVVLTELAKAMDGLAPAPLQTAQSPAAAMSGWLTTGEPPAGFSVDRDCELKSSDEMKSVVRYARHALDTDDVRQHVADGKQPVKLALTWRGRVSLMLTDTLQIRRIGFLDGVFDGAGRGADDGFDADAAIATGELGQLIPDLIDALGGEPDPSAPH